MLKLKVCILNENFTRLKVQVPGQKHTCLRKSKTDFKTEHKNRSNLAKIKIREEFLVKIIFSVQNTIYHCIMFI